MQNPNITVQLIFNFTAEEMIAACFAVQGMYQQKWIKDASAFLCHLFETFFKLKK